jgi:hypothetical protein
MEKMRTCFANVSCVLDFLSACQGLDENLKPFPSHVLLLDFAFSNDITTLDEQFYMETIALYLEENSPLPLLYRGKTNQWLFQRICPHNQCLIFENTNNSRETAYYLELLYKYLHMNIKLPLGVRFNLKVETTGWERKLKNCQGRGVIYNKLLNIIK